MKESRYVKLARTMLNVLMRARVPLYMHRKSNHIYTVWQHLILLALRQYEGKSYRRFVEWLHEAYYLRMFLQLGRIPHHTTLQKFAARMNGTLLYRIIGSFILLTKVRKMFIGIDASGFKSSNASSYYSEIAGVRRKYIKLSICAELRKQLACALKIRRAPRHDTIDFEPVVVRASNIMPLSIVVADKGYDSEANHELVREHLDAITMIPARYGDVPVWRTHGRYRKQMKRRFHRHLYYQRNKNESILSVIKHMFGEHVASRLVRMQNRELIFRVIAYNMHRLTVFMVWFLQSQGLSYFKYNRRITLLVSKTIIEKKLSKSEADDHFIHALLFRDQIKNPLRIRVGEKIIETNIDKRGRIWLPKVRKILKLYTGQTIRLNYNKDGTYTLSVS